LSPSYLASLNPEQRRAALTTEGPVLVLAGAGSGKTRTIVHRIAHLIRGLSVDPRRILAVTFTNRAAGEMRERVATMVGKAARPMALSTFHSLGAGILRVHGERLDIPPTFTIYNGGDQLALVKRILSEEVRIPSSFGADGFDLRRVHTQISDWKNRLIGPEEARRAVLLEDAEGTREDEYAVAAVDVYPRYEASLRAAGACDFDDLLLLPVHLMRDHAEVREALWRRWQYVMVDEYQDTNGAQLEMARLLAGPRKNLCVVGDDDQSIYAWRGADLRNILDFERHFPGAEVVVLETNYRSTARILDAANAVISLNPDRKEKRMRTGNAPGPKLDYWEFLGEPGRPAERQEAEMVAREIGVRRFHEKLAWSDFAVLYRANHQSRMLEEALRAANIPYRVVGGTSYFDRKEVADAIAYLRLALRPADDLSLRRIVNYPSRGIGRTTLFRLLEAAGAARRPLWEQIVSGDEIEGVTRAPAQAVAAFTALVGKAIDALPDAEARAAAGESGALHGWAEAYLDSTGLEDAIRAENSSDRAADMRLGNLRDFVVSIRSYEERVWAEPPLPDAEDEWSPPTLAGFLERVTLAESPDERRESGDDDAPERVTLMTLHSAKGLEFSHVFLVGLEEEILPHSRSIAENGADGDPISEERRLFYVGITRARHRLTLSGCATRSQRGETVSRQRSRFLRDIPDELIEVRSGARDTSLTEEDRQELRQNFFSHMREMLG